MSLCLMKGLWDQANWCRPCLHPFHPESRLDRRQPQVLNHDQAQLAPVVRTGREYYNLY